MARGSGQWLESAPQRRIHADGRARARPGTERRRNSRSYLRPQQLPQPVGQGVDRATHAEHLIVIGRSGAGYDKIDVDACTAHDIALFNAPFGLNHSTASSALMFMLALAKNLRQQERITREGRWDLQPDVMGSEIRGRTL